MCDWRSEVCSFVLLVRFFFFFSSRRRHTRFDCDWSSDVCSSDLASLWFDSLGHGGWWLLFSLVGLIVSFARLQGATTWQRREALIHATRDVVRYVLAGAILAWRLG